MLSSLRFKFDRPSAAHTECKTGRRGAESSLLDQLLLQSVRVREETFPRIFRIGDIAARRLGLNLFPDLFIRCDAAMQASCCVASSDRPVILLSSSIAERLDDAELASVIGHEIGHWFFEHGGTGMAAERHQGIEQLKMLAASRCAEISADRTGLLASRNLNSAVSSLIKVSTGLDERNVRMDVQVFLKQYKEVTHKGPNCSEAMSTHPFFLLRIRALILFAQSSAYYKAIGSTQKKGLSREELDDSIHRDLRKISGLSIDEVDDEIITDILILASFVVFVADGTFSKEEQAFFKETFGEVDIGPYLEMTKSLGIKGLNQCLRQKISALGGVSPDNEDRMRTFFSVLAQTFPDQDTAPLRSTLNSIGFI